MENIPTEKPRSKSTYIGLGTIVLAAIILLGLVFAPEPCMRFLNLLWFFG